MPPELIPDDEDYASEEDSDFAPDAAPTAPGDSSDEDESDADEPVKDKKERQKGKRKRGDEEAEDTGFENSGDEAIIEKGLKRRRRKGKSRDVEDDEGGEGGVVKTRSMRAQEKVERKPLVDTSAATVDVDALWADMIAGKPISKPDPPSTDLLSATENDDESKNGEGKVEGRKERSPNTLEDGPDSMIMIKRTYNFAGKVHTEQKLVPRNSAEAKLYLASQKDQPEDLITEEDSPSTKPKRPTKRARRSVFEPALDIPKRTDLVFGERRLNEIKLLSINKEAKKLNTVEKSAMDWAGFVDKEGIKDDLDAAGKSKGAYKARQEFLARVEQKREEDSRRARGLPV